MDRQIELVTTDAHLLTMEADNFRAALLAQAEHHLDVGDDTSAGMLFTLERRVSSLMNEYQLRVVPVRPTADAPTAAAVPALAKEKCRHEWTDVGPGGSAVCGRCGAPKSARGRKAKAPADGAVQRAPAVPAASVAP